MTTTRTRISLAFLGMVVAACGVTPVPRMATTLPTPGSQPAVGAFDAQGRSKTEYTVALRKGQTADELKAYGRRFGFTVTKYWPQIHSAVIRMTPTGATEAAQTSQVAAMTAGLKSAKSPFQIQPANQVILETVDDPLYEQQYGMKQLNVVDAWAIEPGKRTTTIAVIDTGIAFDHPDLKDRIVPGYNAVKPNESVMDTRGHGTHCAGIAAAVANNGAGVIGVAGNCSLMPVKVIDSGTTDAVIADGVIWAADNGADVATMSIGLYRRSPVFERALQYALDKGVTLVASAGNNSAKNHPEDNPHLPSTYPGVIEVAATDSAGKRAEFSNWGDTVTVAAPGVEVLSTLPGGKYGLKSGTSMAAPHVAGVAALLKSKYPEWKPAQVKAAIEASAQDFGTPGFDPYFGFGRVDALAAVKR
jgi:subtilisin family serine protease